MPKACPHCTLVNPDTARRCDCGYDFQEGRMHATLLATSQGTGPARVSDAMIQEVAVVDIRMPFESMVSSMVKWVLASIPALIILSVLGVLFNLMIRALGLAWQTGPGG